MARSPQPQTFPLMPYKQPVLVSGAGIGGLALAQALNLTGVPFRVFERAPELGEVGSGLGLMMNALRALDALGVGERVRAGGMSFETAEIASYRGHALGGMDVTELDPGARGNNFVAHRADLHRALLKALPEGSVVTGREAVRFEEDGEGVALHFSGGETVRGTVLVGADGLNSPVRRQLHGDDALRYSGQTCYRGIAHVPPPEPGMLREVQGPGRRVGICPLDAGRVYWWAAVNAPEAEPDDPLRRRDDVLDAFEGWPFEFPELVGATAPEGILRNDLVDRGARPRWGRGRVTLLGDAAHPMLPNLGQGASSAIEDAVVLARALATHTRSEDALRAYERQRTARAARLIRDSWQFGIPVRWAHPLAVRLRELALRATPKPVLVRRFRVYTTYDPGSLPAA
jgi:2-polyprenyl-6-methoxyphenol hydroxylase-like FAD-dependent oxidoreductase